MKLQCGRITAEFEDGVVLCGFEYLHDGPCQDPRVTLDNAGIRWELYRKTDVQQVSDGR